MTIGVVKYVLRGPGNERWENVISRGWISGVSEQYSSRLNLARSIEYTLIK